MPGPIAVRSTPTSLAGCSLAYQARLPCMEPAVYLLRIDRRWQRGIIGGIPMIHVWRTWKTSGILSIGIAVLCVLTGGAGIGQHVAAQTPAISGTGNPLI